MWSALSIKAKILVQIFWPTSLDLKRDIIALFCAGLLGLLSTQIIIFVNQHQLQNAVITIFNKVETSGNPYKYSQLIENLEALGLMNCSQLMSESGEIFLDLQYKKNCHTNYLADKIFSFEMQFNSISGSNWRLKTNPLLGTEEKVLLSVIDLLLIILMLFLSQFYRFRLNRLAQIKDLEISKLNALSNLSRQVGHDIKSPLSVLNLAISNFDGIDPNRSKIVASAINRINDIASDLLKGSKSDQPIKEDPSKTTPPRFDISNLMKSIVAEKNFLLNGDRIRVLSDIRSSSQTAIGDSVQVSRIISNILNNSIEAIESRKEGTIDVHFYEKYSEVSIRISDNGIGIPKEILERLGERGVSFGKGDKGNGLGLAYAKETMEYFGGRLEIRSEVNKGTDIELIFKR
jgi:signal transduction histidine kinase